MAHESEEWQDIEFGFAQWHWAVIGIVSIVVLSAAVAVGIAAFVYGFQEYVLAGNQLSAKILIIVLIPVGIASGGACVYVIWLVARRLPHILRCRVRASAHGIELDSKGETLLRWSEIDRFEMGVDFDDEGTAYVTAAVILRNGERVDLHALQRSSLWGRPEPHVAEIRQRITMLNGLLHKAR